VVPQYYAGLSDNELAESFAKTGATLLSAQCSQLTGPGHCKDKATAILFGDEIFLTILSSARFLRFPQKNWSLAFPISLAVNCPDFAATVTAYFCPLTLDRTEGEIL